MNCTESERHGFLRVLKTMRCFDPLSSRAMVEHSSVLNLTFFCVWPNQIAWLPWATPDLPIQESTLKETGSWKKEERTGTVPWLFKLLMQPPEDLAGDSVFGYEVLTQKETNIDLDASQLGCYMIHKLNILDVWQQKVESSFWLVDIDIFVFISISILYQWYVFEYTYIHWYILYIFIILY